MAVPTLSQTLTLDEFFAGFESSRPLFEALQGMLDAIGVCTQRISRSQIAFRRGKTFAWAWLPARYLHRPGAPLVLSLCLPERDASTRWKEVVEPYPGRFMHHLELSSVSELDDEVREWLRQAWVNAGH